MNNLDYTRAFLLDVSKVQPEPEVSRIAKHLKEAQLFILPPGGQLIHDDQLRGIDEKLPLHLPFPVTALEWAGKPEARCHTKNICLLRELDADIELTPLAYDKRCNKWGWQPPIFLDRYCYLERTADRFSVSCRYSSAEHMEFGERTGAYMKFLWTFLSFLNVLSCRNVVTERSPPGAMRKARKTPIAYDTYHVLTLSGGSPGGGGSRAGAKHNSPRSHVRRGCIVRAKTGPHWRNSTIVRPDAEFNVAKAYRLAA